MGKDKQKTWWKSSNRWKYLKVAFIFFTTPSHVYRLAHKSRSVNMRERLIRTRLLGEGVLSNDGNVEKPNIDLDTGHL